MVNKSTYIVLILGVVTFLACNGAVQESAKKNKVDSIAGMDQRDTTTLKDPSGAIYSYVDERLPDSLKPIRENFKRINSITNWSKTIKKDLRETTEGGEANYYYSKGTLEKITTHHYGETFKELTEYYLLNGELSFVFFRFYRYNRPIYYDSAAMKENKDDQSFDINKSKITEVRYYLKNRKLIYQVNNDTYAEDQGLLRREGELNDDFDKLLKLGKEKIEK